VPVALTLVSLRHGNNGAIVRFAERHTGVS